MFGSKKESEPLQPFSLKVLTEHHVVEGTAAGDARLMFSEPSPSPGDLVRLETVTITPVNSRQPVAQGRVTGSYLLPTTR